ncbi:hypothetical protein CTI12_AA141320 [Artemisia annua]|uniref:Uncharacterized protein n=1 Tax=Artemisia annua TaxID=35608 RepID=A0A2U1PK93_ARTAN|nr:hypothetical protein CTI12_AA141320 [Artemisia annua]
MDKAPVYPNSESGDEYDPQLDFAQFLKEAKTHALCHKFPASPLHASEEDEKEDFDGRRKPKKSWKSSIFPWLKKHSKARIIVEEQPAALTRTYSKSKTRQGYVSGPINGIKSCTAERPKRPTSGPLSGFFNHRKKMDDQFQMPYISLGQINSPRDIQSYGPVYLVT